MKTIDAEIFVITDWNLGTSERTGVEVIQTVKHRQVSSSCFAFGAVNIAQ